MKATVLKKTKLITALKAGDFKVDKEGYWTGKDTDFIPEMFDYCGKEMKVTLDDNSGHYEGGVYFWLKEWFDNFKEDYMSCSIGGWFNRKIAWRVAKRCMGRDYSVNRAERRRIK